MKRTTRDGRIAELRAEIILLELGWDVYRPSCDDHNVDLIAGPHSFQVKSAGASCLGNSSYSFWLRGQKRLPSFYALHARDADVWLVVPPSAFGGSVPDGLTTKLEPPTKWQALLAFRDAWPKPEECG